MKNIESIYKKTEIYQKKEQEYLDNMFKNIDEKIKLDGEQQKIILAEEENIMVIAGAGAGKTTTISAKVNYLIDKKNIKDDEILVISYTNKAINELKKRINIDFKHNVKIMTFHKFGYEIIKTNLKKPPKINSNTEETIKKIITNTIKPKKKLKKTSTEELISICISFIKLYKSKGYDEKNINQIKNKRQKQLQEYIKEIYLYYQRLNQQNNEIDFEDIINVAIKIIKYSRQPITKYKYIIVDEYQDISKNRFELIKIISEKTHNKTMVVGDDWQCIYSFASSDINLFINYEKTMPNSKIYKITKTYRNSKELIDTAGKFILKNKHQIKKDLISNKRLDKPITILKYKKNKIRIKFLETLDYLIQKYGKERKILVLGRYTFDKKMIIDNISIIEKNGDIIYKKNPKVTIKYMTIHASKGLGYDNVILINALNKKMGFPSKKKNEKILQQFETRESIKYAEERRLFYVSLTRTKNEVIILTPTRKYSSFVKEIKKTKNVKVKSNIHQK